MFSLADYSIATLVLKSLLRNIFPLKNDKIGNDLFAFCPVGFIGNYRLSSPGAVTLKLKCSFSPLHFNPPSTRASISQNNYISVICFLRKEKSLKNMFICEDILIVLIEASSVAPRVAHIARTGTIFALRCFRKCKII